MDVRMSFGECCVPFRGHLAWCKSHGVPQIQPDRTVLSCWKDAGRGPYVRKETGWIKSVADVNHHLVFDFDSQSSYLTLLPAARKYLLLEAAYASFAI